MNAFDESGNLRAHLFQKQFFVNTDETPVLEVVTDQSPVELILDLTGVLKGPYMLMYDLLASQTGWEEGPYVYNRELDLETIVGIVKHKREFIENDARHRLAIHAVGNQATLVLDEHNVLKLTPVAQSAITRLRAQGFLEQRFEIPFPHTHPYHPEYNEIEDEWLQDDLWVKLEEEDVASPGTFA